MNWENIPASLTRWRAKIPPRSPALAAGAKVGEKLSKMIQNHKQKYFYDLPLKLNNP